MSVFVAVAFFRYPLYIAVMYTYNLISLINSTRDSFTRFSILAFVVLGTAPTVSAQSIERSGRVAFELAPFRLDSSTLKGPGGEADQTDVQVGLGVPNLGIHMGYAFHDLGMIGTRLLVTYRNITMDGGGEETEASLTSVCLLPNIKYVLPSSSSVRPAIGLNLGFVWDTEGIEDGPDMTTIGFAIGPSLEAMIFLDRSVSLDLGILGLYKIGSAEIDGASTEPSVSGFHVGASIGVSLWIPGRLAEDPDRRGHEAKGEGAALLSLAARRPTSKAVREFDRDRAVHVVRAKFALSMATLRMTSAPQIDIDTIDLRFINKEAGVSEERCQNMKLLINEERFTSDSQKTTLSEGHTEISGRYKFEIFKPLGRMNSSFGIEACDRSIEFTAHDMQTLRKFFVLVSQVATDVQKGRIPDRAPLESSETDPTKVEQSQETESFEEQKSDAPPHEVEASDKTDAKVPDEEKANDKPEARVPDDGEASDKPDTKKPQKEKASDKPDAKKPREGEASN